MSFRLISQRICMPTAGLSIPSRNYNASCRVNREGKKWREEHKLTSHINHHKALLDGADYRYLDGRPTPYGVVQYERMMKQRALAQQVVEKLEEIRATEQTYRNKENEKEQEIQNVLDRKLKPKGGFIK